MALRINTRIFLLLLIMPSVLLAIIHKRSYLTCVGNKLRPLAFSSAGYNSIRPSIPITSTWSQHAVLSMSSAFQIDVLRASAQELQEALTSGTITSVALVKQYMDQIEKYNGRLHAVIETTPLETLLKAAKKSDEERAAGNIRGPLHGIPIVAKDNFASHPDLGLHTTGGSFAFMQLRPKATATTLQQLLDAGCILIGKSNLSELANFKGTKMPCGWSARGGQGQSLWVEGGWDPEERFGGHSGPGGSSSGSACAVAAGFAPVAIGTETWGSLIMPATRANVFTLKPSRGLIDMEGVMPVNEILDIAGPMAKSAIDIANFMDAMVKPNHPQYPKEGLASKATGSWNGLRLGAVASSDWRLDEILAVPDEDWFSQQDADLQEAYGRVQSLGVPFKNPIPFPKRGFLGDILAELISHNFVDSFNKYLSSMESTPIRTVEELVRFNVDNADTELPPSAPNQDVLLDALKQEQWTQAQNNDYLAKGEVYAGEEGISRVLAENDINIILGPADSWLTDFACVSGYPSVMLPLSFWKKTGRPFGVIAITHKWREDLLVQLMSAWEAEFPASKAVPKL